ncbi:MAG: cardiolipin synthase [Muribaculaceae bacterium]|nr:cardiolipin synthase [Muribaculaceae bacterium]
MPYTHYFWNIYTIAALWFLYAVLVLTCVVVVLRENRNPIRTLSWVIALIFLPYIGLIFYAFFGRSMRGQTMISRHNKRKLYGSQHSPHVDLNAQPLTPTEKQVVKLAHKVNRYPFTLNNRAQVFTTGTDKFAALKRDLQEARESIYLQYYIFQDDRLGSEIAEILKEKARQGLDVKVIYDHVGSFSSSNKFFASMRQAGVDAHPFFRVTFPQLANRINWRNHRKVVVIDRKVGYIGGMNIADRYLGLQQDGSAWRDTHLRLEGEIVESLLYAFSIDWNFLKTDNLMLVERSVSGHEKNDTGMQLLTSGPTDDWDNLELTYLRAIAGAVKCVYIQTPYFLPTDSLLRALEAAALANVDVRIMLPSKCDSKMLQYAGFSYITQCLKAGIKVYLYSPGMLHSKVMIVDDSFVTTGSVNFDFRSFENNFEGNLLIYDESLNRRMKDIFFADLALCRKLTITAWRKRPLLHRFLESLLRLLSPIL